MEQIKEPTNLTVTKRNHIGLDYEEIYEIYSQDENGNIWKCIERDGVCGPLKLHKKAEDVIWPALSWDQMMEQGRKRQEESR